MKIWKWWQNSGLALCINSVVWKPEVTPPGAFPSVFQFFWLICAMLSADEGSPSPPSLLLLLIAKKPLVENRLTKLWLEGLWQLKLDYKVSDSHQIYWGNPSMTDILNVVIVALRRFNGLIFQVSFLISSLDQGNLWSYDLKSSKKFGINVTF